MSKNIANRTYRYTTTKEDKMKVALTKIEKGILAIQKTLIIEKF